MWARDANIKTMYMSIGDDGINPGPTVCIGNFKFQVHTIGCTVVVHLPISMMTRPDGTASWNWSGSTINTIRPSFTPTYVPINLDGASQLRIPSCFDDHRFKNIRPTDERRVSFNAARSSPQFYTTGRLSMRREMEIMSINPSKMGLLKLVLCFIAQQKTSLKYFSKETVETSK